jgi:hypothetical protein
MSGVCDYNYLTDCRRLKTQDAGRRAEDERKTGRRGEGEKGRRGEGETET